MLKNKLKIAIVSGGLSNERAVSIKTGQQVFKNLSNKKFDKSLIEISKEGKWLLTRSKTLKGKFNRKALTIMHPKQGIANNGYF